MRSLDELEIALALIERGFDDCEIARQTRIPRSTVRPLANRGPSRYAAEMRTRRVQSMRSRRPRLRRSPQRAVCAPSRAQLGDGHLARHLRGVYRLCVALDARYPGIVDACADAMEKVMPGHEPHRRRLRGGTCIVVSLYSKQWPCLLPQHAPGPKHGRAIVLTRWQQRHVDRHPAALLRGLIQSDGWRGVNRVRVRGKEYCYPRYTFANRSEDIKRIFCSACDAVGVQWRRMNAKDISVAQREAVARLDAFIGVKY